MAAQNGSSRIAVTAAPIRRSNSRPATARQPPVELVAPRAPCGGTMAPLPAAASRRRCAVAPCVQLLKFRR